MSTADKQEIDGLGSEVTAVHMADIVEGLTKLGMGQGDAVLVHSSLRSFGYVDGGADAVIDALLETVGPSGTIMVPTLTGSEKLSVKNPPIFAPSATRCWTGRIPETFRKRPEAIRSRHPTHSVAAIGKDAEYLTRGHERCVTPCGIGSPYWKLAVIGGYILFLGVGLGCNTTFHTVEELANAPYHMQPEWVDAKIINDDLRVEVVRVKIHLYGPERDFERMEPTLLSRGIMKLGRVGRADVRLVRAKPMIDLALRFLESDPKFLLKA
jgi:aminoglycoside 3-N-acetyltransferase